ncbi:hypothetical protein DPMN_071414 [Dreissena polymorpha]|uniref:Uncharacterized protein n=2 Tax=Dreissena polymorpha TaxID=45954 RepID=A0A9D3Z6N4_DREPO|nr:hypothetical protein DPMN_071414 [Dreissena polymorpha]
MVIGLVVYMTIAKIKKKAQVNNVAEREVLSPPPKVRPLSATRIFPTRAMLNRPPPPKNTDF